MFNLIWNMTIIKQSHFWLPKMWQKIMELKRFTHWNRNSQNNLYILDKTNDCPNFELIRLVAHVGYKSFLLTDIYKIFIYDIYKIFIYLTWFMIGTNFIQIKRLICISLMNSKYPCQNENYKFCLKILSNYIRIFVRNFLQLSLFSVFLTLTMTPFLLKNTS